MIRRSQIDRSSPIPATRRPDLMTNEIAETYTYAADGTISVRIENVSGGYARTFALGALR